MRNKLKKRVHKIDNSSTTELDKKLTKPKEEEEEKGTIDFRKRDMAGAALVKNTFKIGSKSNIDSKIKSFTTSTKPFVQSDQKPNEPVFVKENMKSTLNSPSEASTSKVDSLEANMIISSLKNRTISVMIEDEEQIYESKI